MYRIDHGTDQGQDITEVDGGKTVWADAEEI